MEDRGGRGEEENENENEGNIKEQGKGVCVLSLAAAVACFSLLQMINQLAMLLNTGRSSHTQTAAKLNMANH